MDLTASQEHAIAAAKQVMITELAYQAGDDAGRLYVSTIIGSFVELCASAAMHDGLMALVNQELEAGGLQLVEKRA
jgi:hypothetical protein